MIVVAVVTDRAEAIDVLAGFREQLYRCMTRRADALFELTDALLCTDGPVKTLVGLSLAPEHRRGHGAMYDALNPQRSFYHTYGRGKDEHHMIPGRPYSIVAALETGRTSWTALLDAVRLPPARTSPRSPARRSGNSSTG